MAGDKDKKAADDQRDEKEAARIRDEALKRALGMGSKPKPKDERAKRAK